MASGKYIINPMWMREQKPVILVVDDSRDIREALKDFFELEGFNVVSAINGREALDYLSNDSTIGAVVTDYMMPELDGLGLRNLIRSSSEHYSSIPIILLSGADKELLSQWPSSDPFLAKPVNFDILIETLGSLIF